MVALPGASPITLRSLPETLAVATLEASEAAPYLRASPSGSENAPEMSTGASVFSTKTWSGIAPDTVGARLALLTVTSKVWLALRPPGSVAVTVMVALPGASPITLRSLPETLAVATLEASEAAPYLRASPSGSENAPEMSTGASVFSTKTWSGIAPDTVGARLALLTVTSKVWLALRPPGSVAVTVMVALPGASPITLRSLPETLAVATLEASEAAPYLRASPSGSENAPEMSTVTCAPSSTLWSAIVVDAVGARFVGGAGGLVDV